MRECEVILKKALNEERSSLLLNESHAICRFHGIHLPELRMVTDIDEAARQANEIGFPVALKIVSPEILHKSDVGGVVLDVKDEVELRIKYTNLIEEVQRKALNAEITGVAIEKMVPPGIELIAGGIRDSQFGPCVMLGIGGIFAELYDDVSFRVAPIDRTDALSLIRDLRGSRILQGTRGKHAVDLDSIVNVLMNVSKLMIEHDQISEVDLNPVIAYPDSVSAVDSRIILRESRGAF